jgi:hypothetical protein
VLSIFSFSFGDRIRKADYVRVSFLGQILHSSDLSNWSSHAQNIEWIFSKKNNISVLDKANKGYTLVSQPYLKPLVSLPFNEEKIIFMPKAKPITFTQKKKEPIIMFHPLLPEHFLFYFQDRQAVHIELMFNIISTGKTNSIAIKRKTASGNLEADLLSMRYISHYLFIQQARFTPNNWQTVKIDLSAKND